MARCKECREPVVFVPDRGGQWIHYRATFTCRADPIEPATMERRPESQERHVPSGVPHD